MNNTKKLASPPGCLARLVVHLRALRHRIAHWTGCNHGTVKVWHSKSGRLMVGFQCDCGKLSGVHEAHPSGDAARAMNDAKRRILGDES
jgi:hypothetical protein